MKLQLILAGQFDQPQLPQYLISKLKCLQLTFSIESRDWLCPKAILMGTMLVTALVEYKPNAKAGVFRQLKGQKSKCPVSWPILLAVLLLLVAFGHFCQLKMSLITQGLQGTLKSPQVVLLVSSKLSTGCDLPLQCHSDGILVPSIWGEGISTRDHWNAIIVLGGYHFKMSSSK